MQQLNHQPKCSFTVCSCSCLCSFSFFSVVFFSCQVCVFSETYVQCEFHFSVLSVFFGVKSIEPNCPNKKNSSNKQIKRYHVNMSVVFIFSLFVSVFVVFFCQSSTVSCVCFLCISTPHHLVYHIVSCCCSPFFIRLWSYTHAHFCCCAAHFHWHTCEKTTDTYITLHDDPGIHPHYTYMRLVWFFMLFIFSNILHQCHQNSMDSKNVRTHRFCNFDLRVYFHFRPVSSLTLPLFRSLCKNVDTKSYNISRRHKNIYDVLCTVYCSVHCSNISYRFSFKKGGVKRRCCQAFINLHRFIND